MPQAQAGRTHGFESPSPWSVEAGTPHCILDTGRL